jgi:hypothetical protein
MALHCAPYAAFAGDVSDHRASHVLDIDSPLLGQIVRQSVVRERLRTHGQDGQGV